MGKKFKLNKSELTRLRREEKIYSQFLPVLKLKQEQLQMEQIRIRKELINEQKSFDDAYEKCEKIIELLPDETYLEITKLVKPRKIKIIKKFVAGVQIPFLDNILNIELFPSYLGSQAWLLNGLDKLRKCVYFNVKIEIRKKQFDLITKELRKSTQKVNLFEKILIPETKDALKRIKIFLGDEQVAAVGRGKISKKNKR